MVMSQFVVTRKIFFANSVGSDGQKREYFKIALALVIKNLIEKLEKMKASHVFCPSQGSNLIFMEEFFSNFCCGGGGVGVACPRIYCRSCSSTLLPIKHYHGYLKLFREGVRPGLRRGEGDELVQQCPLWQFSWGKQCASSSQMCNPVTLCNFLSHSLRIKSWCKHIRILNTFPPGCLISCRLYAVHSHTTIHSPQVHSENLP